MSGQEKEMATHSSILAWRIPWTEELCGLQYTDRKESDTTERLHFHFHFYVQRPGGRKSCLLCCGGRSLGWWLCKEARAGR